MLETAPDNANVVCEVDGEINRVPLTEFGIKVAIIKKTGNIYSCDNMTYEEAVECLTNGVPFLICVLGGASFEILQHAYYNGTSTINIIFSTFDIEWTSDGITSNASPVS